MAKQTNTTAVKREKAKVSRKGIHSKTKSSTVKTSKLYKKRSRGQG